LKGKACLLEQIWLEKLSPLGEPGYNSGSIRRM
jgi:hypothetical protein